MIQSPFENMSQIKLSFIPTFFIVERKYRTDADPMKTKVF